MQLYYVKFTEKNRLAYSKFAHGEWELFSLEDAKKIQRETERRPEVAEAKIYRAAYVLGSAK